MKRFKVHFLGSWKDDDVLAESEADAIEKCERLAEVEGWLVEDVKVEPIAYDVPRGAERYAEVAESILFCTGPLGHRYVASVSPGSWWWTDGHAAVRCDGDAPAGVTKVGTTIEGVARETEPRRVATWGDDEVFCDVHVMREVEDDRVMIADKYRNLVECWPDVEWQCARTDDPEPAYLPLLAYSGGALVAIVMGMRDHAAQERRITAMRAEVER